MKRFFRASASSPLNLELLRPHKVRERLGVTFLVASIILVMAAAAHYLHSMRQIAVLETDIAQAAYASELAIPTADSEDVKAVKAVVGRLALPWGRLFVSLEEVANENIHLISVEPTVDKSVVRIIAEAPEIYEMLNYLRALGKQPDLQDVLLTGYEVSNDKGEQAVRFTLTASWGRTQ